MLRVGLTGGIASGKTTVASLFGEHGAGIVDTDIVAREVVAPGQPGLEAVGAEFGSGVISDSGELDRRALRDIVFADPDERRKLEALLHPLIRANALRQIERLDAPYALVIVPLLVETGFGALVDRIAVVDCSREAQLERLMARDEIGPTDAEAILNAQVDRESRLARAHDVIDNGGSLEATRERVGVLHAKYVQATGSEGD